jgi:hypothetical protein
MEFDMSEEKRQYIRHPASIPIVCECTDMANESTSTANALKEPLRNISLGGLCFLADCAFEPGTSIMVRIDLVRPVFRGGARVVWCRRSDDLHYDVGVQFQDPNTGARARIVEQICHIEQYKHDMLEAEGRHLSGEEAAIEWIHKYADDFPQA